MPSSLSLTSEIDKVRIFQCPHCKETIDMAEKHCRFCSAVIDTDAAEEAAELMARINQACSDSSYMRTASISILVFLGLTFVPILSWLGLWGFYFLLFAVPVMAVRWWIRFGLIGTDDAEFIRARRTVAVVSALLFFPVLRALSGLMAGIFSLGAR